MRRKRSRSVSAIDASPLERWLVATLFGVAIALLSWLWRFPWLPPELWEDTAIAAGLRPPEALFPLLWNALVSYLFQFAGPAHAIRIIVFAGHVGLGMVAALAALIFEETLPPVLQRLVRRAGWSRWIVRAVFLNGAFLFVCSDPVWAAGRAFGPLMFDLLLLLSAIYAFIRAMRRLRFSGFYLAMSITGVLAAESPFGVVLAVLFLVCVRIRAEISADIWVNPLADPFARVLLMRRMTAVSMGMWLCATALNISFFCMSDGLEAHEWSGFLTVVNYLHRYVQITTSAATPAGWLLVGMVVLAPLVLSIAHVNAATDDDRFMPYWYSVFFAMVGVMAFLQLSGWRSFWFWTWTGADSVKSGLLRCACMALCAQTVLYCLCVLSVEIYFRNYRRIAGVRYQDSLEDTALGPRLAATFRLLSRWGRRAVSYEPLIVLALLLPYKVQSTSRGIVGALRDCAMQTAFECQDARYLFTDGAMDAAVELCALVQGRDVRAVSLLSGYSPRDRYIRARMAMDEEDRGMLRYSGADALRTWLRLKPGRMKGVALQLGFELWARGTQPPPCAGLVARPAGFPQGLAEAGAEMAHGLVERVLAMYGADDKLSDVDPALGEVFSFMQWRLARMCRLRADGWDRKRQIGKAMDESRRADSLDAQNLAFARVRRQMEMVGQGGMRLTPREGMKIGMDRADFKMAEVFARQVLLSDPEDVAANFVVGMNYFGEEQYGRAEVYLKKCLEKRPKDPAILNNLAVAQMRLRNFDAAEENVRKALAVQNDAPEVKRTLENILKQRAEADKEQELSRLIEKNAKGGKERSDGTQWIHQVGILGTGSETGR